VTNRRAELRSIRRISRNHSFRSVSYYFSAAPCIVKYLQVLLININTNW